MFFHYPVANSLVLLDIAKGRNGYPELHRNIGLKKGERQGKGYLYLRILFHLFSAEDLLTHTPGCVFVEWKWVCLKFQTRMIYLMIHIHHRLPHR